MLCKGAQSQVIDITSSTCEMSNGGNAHPTAAVLEAESKFETVSSPK